jgi:16S rRNA (guanine527-N7)-methyltransferase
MILQKYFPELDDKRLRQFDHLHALYKEWNEKINVISRKDVGQLEIHHILHSLAIAKIFPFQPGTRIMDAGTGGGLPGLPLAIFFAEVEFTLVDSIEKKIRVVTEISRELGLTNVVPVRMRFEEMKKQFDFITGRAVTRLSDLYPVIRKNISPDPGHYFANGMIYLKGGDFGEELSEVDAGITVYPVTDYFDEAYFETKKVVHIFPEK